MVFGLVVGSGGTAAGRFPLAQKFVAPKLPSAAEQVANPVNALTDAISSLLSKGRTLESNGRWAEALTYYEEALHEYPEDPSLQARFDVARLHYSLEQRYDDRSFRDSLRTLRPQQALDLYNDLLSKIEAHYYTTPPWQDLARRGAQSMDIALADEGFLRNHGIRVRGQQVDHCGPKSCSSPASMRSTRRRMRRPWPRKSPGSPVSGSA